MSGNGRFSEQAFNKGNFTEFLKDYNQNKVKDLDPVISNLKDNEELLVKLLAREFLSNFEVSFSRPDTVSLKSQMEAFDEFEQAVDKISSI
jgi:hypothetical protein